MTESIPTDRELEALKVLWRRRGATVREICDAINDGGEELAYTTVLSLMQVMEQKGLVDHQRTGKAYVYSPKVERAPTFRRLAAGFLDKVFDGAMDEYLVHALQSRNASAEQLNQLAEMIAQAKGRLRRRNKKGDRK
ncbi:MAG: BlaI/MecI/CopY family transcriptional regulator [Planctomycetota bacterium]